MRYCPECRRPVMEGQAYCDNCGASLALIPDQSMIDAARNGNQAALSQLYTLAYDGVYYTVHAMIRDEETVLDVVQDSFIKGFENLHRLQDPSRFAAWMKAIARNMAIDELRRKKPLLFSQMATEENDAVLEFEDDRTENLPDVALDQRETARLVREILDSLPEDQRVAVALFYYEGLSVRQIAQKLGIPENTVKSRLSLGRKKIETKVRSLERQGVRLYSLSPIAFLLLLLRQQGGHAGYGFQEVFDVVRQTLLQQGAIPAAYQSVSASGAAAGKAAVTAGKATATAAAGHSVAAKVAAIVLAAAVTLGGGAFAIHEVAARRAPQEPPAAVELPSAPSEADFPVAPAAPGETQQATGRWSTADGSAELWIQEVNDESVTFSLFVPGRGSLNNVVATHLDGENAFRYEDPFREGRSASGSLTSDLDGHYHIGLSSSDPALDALDLTFPVRSAGQDYETLYAPVLEAYREHEQNGGGLINHYGDEPGYVHVGLYDAKRYGYFLWDLDDNGVPELVLGVYYTDEDYAASSWLDPAGYNANLILDLYTLQDGSPVYLTNSGDRYRYSLTTQGTIYFEGSGGAAYTYIYLYRVNGAALEYMDGLCIDGGEDNCYRVLDPEDWQHINDQHISYEEFSERTRAMSAAGHEKLGLIQPWLKPVAEQQAETAPEEAAPGETSVAALPPYADVVQMYANLQVQPRINMEGWSYANPPTYEMLERRYGEFWQDEPFEPYYALYDTNRDGTPELFIGLAQSDGSIALSEVYSTDGQRAYRIAVGGFRRNLLGSGKILVEGGEFFPMGEMITLGTDGHTPVQLLSYCSGCDDPNVSILQVGEEPDFYYETRLGYQSEHYPFSFLNESMAAGMRPAEEVLNYQRIQPDDFHSRLPVPGERTDYDGMLERYIWYLDGTGGTNGLDEDMVRMIDAYRSASLGGFAYAYFDGDCDGTEELYLGFPFGQNEHYVICYHVDERGILHQQQAARFTGEELEFTRAPWRWVRN